MCITRVTTWHYVKRRVCFSFYLVQLYIYAFHRDLLAYEKQSPLLLKYQILLTIFFSPVALPVKVLSSLRVRIDLELLRVSHVSWNSHYLRVSLLNIKRRIMRFSYDDNIFQRIQCRRETKRY